jgi:hypothetical protein
LKRFLFALGAFLLIGFGILGIAYYFLGRVNVVD